MSFIWFCVLAEAHIYTQIYFIHACPKMYEPERGVVRINLISLFNQVYEKRNEKKVLGGGGGGGGGGGKAQFKK